MLKTKKKVLVVEDEKSLRCAMVDILNLKNYTAIEACDGQLAVELALSEHPDLILLDLIIPKIDGMAALKIIREDVWGKDVPVIILTNLSMTSEKIVEDVVLHKPLHYLVKLDWKIHDVIKKVEEALV
jgi:DNA-binding response OmpR family regulator